MKRLLITLIVLLASGGCMNAPPAADSTAVTGPQASEADLRRYQTDLRQAIERGLAAYVFVGGGSGAIISPDGYVITNHHVAGGAKAWRIHTADGQPYVADLVGSVPASDLALLKIRDGADLPYLTLGDSDALEPGQTVLAVGNPFGVGTLDHTPTVTQGVVGAVGVDRAAAGDAVVTDAPVNPGNSGGPLIDLAGNLVGVNGQSASRFGIRANAGTGYAISSNQVRRFLDALKTAGPVVHLGSINGATFEQLPSGSVRVREVLADSPAAEAGLQAGDIALLLGDWPVLTATQLQRLARRYPAGSRVGITVRRGEQSIGMTLALERREMGGLGIVFDPTSRSSLDIAAVIPDGPADQAGLQPGDTILRIAGRPLPNRAALQALVPRISPGQQVPLTIERDGQERDVNVRAIAVSELRRLQQRAENP